MFAVCTNRSPALDTAAAQTYEGAHSKMIISPQRAQFAPPRWTDSQESTYYDIQRGLSHELRAAHLSGW
jgi:hypothetical protein